MHQTVHGFVDGAYIRRKCEELKRDYPDPYLMVYYILNSQGYQHQKNSQLTRVTYYDAAPDNSSDVSPHLLAYWDAVERLDDTQLGFGMLRGGRRNRPRQKAVDTLIATDMLVGAFTGVFKTAILVAGDADFVPVVIETKRRGVNVIVAGLLGAISDDLILAADRYYELDDLTKDRFPSIRITS